MKFRTSAALAIASLALLAAHEYRVHSLAQALAWFCLIPLLFTRLDPARRIVQIALLAGVLVYADVALDLIRFRMAFGLPWTRLALIMAGVCGFILVSGLGLSVRAVRERLARHAERSVPVLIASGLTFLTLAGLQLGLPRPMLIFERFSPGAGWLEITLIALYAGLITLRMLDPARSAHTRRVIWTIFTVAFFGQLLLGLSGLDIFLMTGKLHLPVPALIIAGPIYRGEGFFMPILFASTLVLVGPAWCSHLCYIGAWDNLNALAAKPQSPPAWRHPLRLTIAALVILTAILLRLLDVPASIALTLAAVFGLASVGVMLTLSRRLGLMFHCIAICPIGLIANIAGRLSPWGLRVSPDCTRCNACSRVCRYAALTPVDLARHRPGLTCTLCGDCLNACRHTHIEYAFLGRTSPAVRTAFVTLIVSLHAVFLAVARI